MTTGVGVGVGEAGAVLLGVGEGGPCDATGSVSPPIIVTAAQTAAPTTAAAMIHGAAHATIDRTNGHDEPEEWRPIAWASSQRLPSFGTYSAPRRRATL